MRVLNGVRQRTGVIDLSDPNAAAFRTLRVATDLEQAQDGVSTVLFTAPVSGEGTSTIAANHALLAAAARRSTLLVDCNLGRPSIHERFRTDRAPGVVDVVLGDVSFEQAVRRTASGHVELSILPAGTPLQDWADLLSASDLADVLSRATESFDTVVIDAPPVLDAPDAALLAALPGVEAVLVVHTEQRRKRVSGALKQLRRAGGNVIGVTLNAG